MQQEVPFTAGMEREPPEGWREVTVTLDAAGKKAWRLDGMLHRLVEIAGNALGKVRSLADRGPADYAESEFERGMRAGRRTIYTNGDSREPNGEKRLLQWILGVLSTLVVLATAGGVTLYGKFTALEATVTTGMNAHEQRLNRVEQRLDRIGTSANSP